MKSSSKKNQEDDLKNVTNTISLIFLTLYLFIPTISNAKYQDFYGMHWFLLSVMNAIVCLYLFFANDNIITKNLPHFIKNKIYLVYIAFTIISGISIVVALNLNESLVQYSRLLNTLISFTLLGLLFIGRKELFSKIALIIVSITFLESFFVLIDFYKNTKGLNMNALILETIKWTTGNKNIFVATLSLKLPFIIYSFFKQNKFWKYFSLITLLLTTHIIYLSVTRTAFVSMSFVFAIMLLGSLILLKENRKSAITQFGITTLVCIISCFLGQLKINSLTNKAAIQNNTAVTNTVVDNKAQVLEKLKDSEGNVRFKYWEHAYEYIKENPVLGVGYGNYKLYTPNYVKYVLGENTFSKHPHNDFIFVAAESGVGAFILYATLFLLGFYYIIKNLFKKDVTDEHKIINIVLLASLATCFLDAFFNFPKERPVTQLLLMLLFVLIIIVNYKNAIGKDVVATNNNSSILKTIIGLTFVISLVMIYTNNVILDSMIAQGKADTDYHTNGLKGKPMVYNYNQIKELLPSYPNISEFYEPVDAKLARYLRAEKRYNEAIQLLKDTESYHPYYSERNNTIAQIYYHNLKNNDSAYYYIVKALDDKPKNFSALQLATYLMTEKKDYNKIIESYNRFYKYSDENEENYSHYCNVLYTAGYPYEKLNPKVKEGLKKYPKNEHLNKLSNYLDSVLK